MWKAEGIERAEEQLLRQGFLPKAPIRKSEWVAFPYCVPIWRDRSANAPRLHTWWRHGAERQKIYLPYGSAAFTAEWFKFERDYALRHGGAHIWSASEETSKLKISRRIINPLVVLSRTGGNHLQSEETPCSINQSRPSIDSFPLYPDEDQIALGILGAHRAHEWKAKAVILEREGLPPIDTLMGGRPWKAVQQFFAQRNGLDEGISRGVKSSSSHRVRSVPFVPDGREVLNAQEETAVASGRNTD
jgi:hypothetical protein